ncbi:MAG TPA: acid phosphatase [Dehalococcoidia bacterium]
MWRRSGVTITWRGTALLVPALAGIGLLCGGVSPAAAQSVTGGLNRIGHIVVLYEENHSFDNFYGNFPGATGLAQASAAQMTQVNRDGSPMQTLTILNTTTKKPDDRIPGNLPPVPFKFNDYYQPSQKTGDMIHAFYTEQLQIDGGKMDKFAAWSDSHGQSMGYWDISGQPLYELAKQYTVDDNFFHAAFGGSFLNHFWLICACTPVFPNAPADMVATMQPNGTYVKDNPDGTTAEFAVTPDGHAVNTTQPLTAPYNKGTAQNPGPDDAHRLPLQTMPTIGDELSAKGVSWAWFAGGWNNAVAGNPDPLYQYHHQPFNYFKNYASGQARTDHLKDETDFMAALQSGNVPAVSFVKPLGPDNEHPGYTDIVTGEQHAMTLINAIKASPIWNDAVIVVTYDEHGGSFDHVPPPTLQKDGARADQWGPGVRVPTIVISPFARQHFVDHTQYDTTSILKLIEERFGVSPLGTRDAAVNDLTGSLTLAGGSAADPLPGTGSGGQAGAARSATFWQLFAIAALLTAAGGYAVLAARRRA